MNQSPVDVHNARLIMGPQIYVPVTVYGRPCGVEG